MKRKLYSQLIEWKNRQTFITMKRLSLIIVLLSFVFNCSALDFSRGLWRALDQRNIMLKLKEYGAYDFNTGQCLNRFTPSGTNAYESASLVTDEEGTRFVWGLTSDGNWAYRVRINDDIMYLTGRRPTSGGPWQPWNDWIKILDWSGSRIFTVSKQGTYRVWEVWQR